MLTITSIAPTVVLLGPVPSNADPFATIPPPYDATSAIISTQNRTGGIKQEEVSPSGSTVVATEPQESARSRKPEKYAGVRKVRMNRGHKACPPPQLLWYAKENGRYREYWI